MSTPHYPQSNGHAKYAVKAMKLLMMKTTTNGRCRRISTSAIAMEWRNTPRSDGQNSAQHLLGRPLSSFLFAHYSIFAKVFKEKRDELDSNLGNATAKLYYDTTAKPLKPLVLGNRVDVDASKNEEMVCYWHGCGHWMQARLQCENALRKDILEKQTISTIGTRDPFRFQYLLQLSLFYLILLAAAQEYSLHQDVQQEKVVHQHVFTSVHMLGSLMTNSSV